MATAWYVASFRNKQYALYHLNRQGFGTWCPTLCEDRYHHGKVVCYERPLFGQYLLVNFDIDEDPWERINGTIGVKRLLPLSEINPRPIPTDFVETLMDYEAHKALTPEAVFDLARGYLPGDWLDIKRGTYGGNGAHFLRADHRKGLIIVLIRLMNRPVPVSISPYCVDAKPMVMLAPQTDRA